MKLTFKHCQFNPEDVSTISVEFLRAGPRPGDGGKPFFLVTLASGENYQVTPDSVIEPTDNADPYYRDKDASWTALCGMQQVIHDGYCRWYKPDETKIMAAKMGYEVRNNN